MRTENSSDHKADPICASCGISEHDEEVKLKKCTACKLVRYCNVVCQKEHRPQHKRECKRRVAELRDDMLFRQPEESHLGDCPICFLPFPLDRKATYHPCCSKYVCNGCVYGFIHDSCPSKSCPFCRSPIFLSREDGVKMSSKRIEAGDTAAMSFMAMQHFDEQNYSVAVELWKKAAEVGNAIAHTYLAHSYSTGEGLQKDRKKEMYHLEEAAIGGHPVARYNLGNLEIGLKRYDRAKRHFIIAANLGDDESINALKEGFKSGFVTKEELAAALRSHKAAVDATKSPKREAAAQYKN